MTTLRHSWLLVAFLCLIQVAPAAANNLAALILIQRLGYAHAFMAPKSADAPSRLSIHTSDGVPTWLPASPMRAVLTVWNALLAEDPDEATAALEEAAALRSGFTRSLDDFGRFPTAFGLVPVGLAENEYRLARDAIRRQDWEGSLRAFERAVVHRPGPWPAGFVAAYSAALARVHPEMSNRIAAEQSSGLGTPQVKVGRKDQNGWDIPLPLADGRRLEGFRARSWTAVERGLPFVMDLFWTGGAANGTRETVQAWNILANGGLELSTPAFPNQFGWAQAAGAMALSVPLTRTVTRGTTTSRVLMSPPASAETSTEIWTHRVRVTPARDLLWSAWIESHGANPHLFLSWYDGTGKKILDEIPVQGNVTGQARRYAGVLHAPSAAVRLSIMLANWKSAGDIYWDDLFLAELPPATEPGRPAQ